MKKGKLIIMTLSALALLLASCEKDPVAGRRGSAPAIKLTVDGVYDTKASAIDSVYLQNTLNEFKISAYVTESWRRDRIGGSPVIPAGIYVDPGFYEGPYDESKYPTECDTLKDVTVKYYPSLSPEQWRIAGNEDYDTPAFSWVSGVATNFFAYAPVTVKGTRTISKADNSLDETYPFTYKAQAQGDSVVTSATCEDIIFAYTQHVAAFEADSSKANYGDLIDGSTDKFSLKFYHALAQIRFCVSTDDDTYDSGVTLSYIKLGGVEDKSTTPSTYPGIPSSGSCVFTGPSTFTWSSLADSHIYSQTFNAKFPDPTAASLDPSGWTRGTYGSSPSHNLYTCNDVLFVIPQSLSECVVEVGFEDVATGEKFSQRGHLPATTSSSTDVSWEAGKYYTYKIKASKGLGFTLLTPGWIDGGADVSL